MAGGDVVAARLRRTPPGDAFPTDGALFWIASGVLGYSCLVLFLALESMAVAELALRFQLLSRFAIVGLILLGTVGLFFKVAVAGWKVAYALPLVSLVLLLPGVQPSESCCSELVAYIAGHPSASTPVLSGVLWHFLPMIGCGLLIVDEVRSRRLSLRRETTQI